MSRSPLSLLLLIFHLSHFRKGFVKEEKHLGIQYKCKSFIVHRFNPAHQMAIEWRTGANCALRYKNNIHIGDIAHGRNRPHPAF